MHMHSLVLLSQTVWEETHLQENSLYMNFDHDLGVNVSQNVAQYPLHHVTYATTKFEVATSNGIGDTFTQKYII